MKKIVLFALCAMVLASCQKANIEPQADEPEEWGVINLKGKKFVFTVKGDFGAAGNLFGSGGTLDVSVNEAWESPLERTW